ncbi:MAG: hypothetical protein IJP77_05260 [Bacteroidales bacterium]|nr:hypothetical protein [Bacteroidales bacterium]
MKPSIVILAFLLTILFVLVSVPVSSGNPGEIPPGCEIADEFDYDEGEYIEPWHVTMTNCGPAYIGHVLVYYGGEYICYFTGSPSNFCFLSQIGMK